MGLTSLQVCMDSSDWLQGTIDEETGMDSSSSPSGDMLTCSRPLIERRLRPPHDQALKCPRCDSTHTKFCYYNNYSLSQPRYFCKTCRRYWTKGGTLRNIPVGGGCRKNKKVTSKKSNDHQNTPQNLGSSSPILNNNSINPTDLHLSIFPDQMQQFSHHFTNILNPNNFMLENPLPIDFMVGSSSSRNHDFMGNGGHDHHHMGSVSNCHDININSAGIIQAQNFHNFCSPFGMYLDGNSTNAGHGEALMLPYETNHHHHEDHQNSVLDVKPNAKHLALEWHDQQGCSDVVGKDSFDYFNGVAGGSSWPGLMNGYGTSATNPSLV